MTHYCPITYELIEENALYSKSGLRQLSPKLTTLAPLAYSSQEQRNEAMLRASKLSIQGVQPKLSARLDLKQQTFVFVDIDGEYILKPESDTWPELPANEAISMTLAQQFSIDVPVHGLVFTKNDELTYFIRRFDRQKHKKIAIEDFAQLSNLNRDTKYNSSVEKVTKVIHEFCTFPNIEYISLFRRVLFNFIIGNEDMHLKNYSLINQDDIWKLAPAYDFLNTTIALQHPEEESALPINGRKNELRRQDFVDYLAINHLRLTRKVVDTVMAELEALHSVFIDLIARSYLTGHMKDAYVKVLNERYKRLYNS
jgi:serine/threonine-protein kinase HipA